MDAQPASSQTQDMRAQEEVLNRRRTILEQVAELLVVCHLQVTADGNSERGARKHLAIGQGGGDC
jgi:hypothetical protein